MSRDNYQMLFSAKDFETLSSHIASAHKEHANLLRTVKREIGGKKLRQDKNKRRQQVDDIVNRLSPVKEMEWNLDKAIAYGNELDTFPKMQNSKYEGIKTRGIRDNRRKRLFTSLSTQKNKYLDIFADKELNTMINEYIDWSFVGSSICLFVELLNWFAPVDIQPTEYIDSGAYAPYQKVQNTMARLRTRIDTKIRELTHEPEVVNLPVSSKET